MTIPGVADVELILVAGAWPSADVGYGIAMKATLAQYLRAFARVHYIGLHPQAFGDMASWNGAAVTWIHVPITLRPKWLRFLLSLPTRLPAAAMMYTPTRKPIRQAVRAIRREARQRRHKVVLVFDGMPAAVVWPSLRRAFPDLPTAVRSHDVLVRAYEGCEQEGSWLERLSWRIEVAKLGHFEKRMCALTDRLWAISQSNAQEYRERMCIHPDGVFGVSLDASRYADIGPGCPRTVLFMGMADLRTMKSLLLLVRLVWPAVRAEVPDARLILAGRNTEGFTDVTQGVEGLGFVADDRTALARAPIFVNPQHIGSGVKLKSIVAMLAGRAVVSTPTGIQGVEGIDGEHFLVAGDWQELAAKTVSLLKAPPLASQIGRSARTLAAAQYSQDCLARAVQPLLTDFAALAAS